MLDEAAEGGTARTQAFDEATLTAALADIGARAASCSFTLDSEPPGSRRLYGDERIARDTTHQNGWDFEHESKRITLYGRIGGRASDLLNQSTVPCMDDESSAQVYRTLDLRQIIDSRPDDQRRTRRPVGSTIGSVTAVSLIFAVAACGTSARSAGSVSLGSIVESVRRGADPLLIDVAIATEDQICHTARYDSPSSRRRLTAEGSPPRFHAASISKLLTATVIVQLQEEGKLSLSDPVGKYERRFGGSPIRLIDLMTHTSGLRDLERASGRRSPGEVDDYVSAFAAQQPTHAPGEHWEYSDGGYNLLGRVIERVTGQPFAQAMRERLLVPLGMRNSDFDIDRVPTNARVIAYSERGVAFPHPWDLAFLPSSGLQTTAEDLAKFAQANLMVLSEGAGPIRRRSLLDMTHARFETAWSGINQGLGWQLAQPQGRLQWRHAGGGAGFEGLLAIYPDAGFAIVVLGNQKDWPRFELERKLRKLLSRDNGFDRLCPARADRTS